MSFLEGLVWVLRVFGALYVVAGLFMARQMWFWARISPDMARLGEIAQELSADVGEKNEAARDLAETDRGRPWWLFVGALLMAVAGAAMVVGHRIAVVLLAAIIVHQLFYFVRQRRRELGARTPAAAAEARVERSTINGFFMLLLVTVLAAWLYYEGALI